MKLTVIAALLALSSSSLVAADLSIPRLQKHFTQMFPHCPGSTVKVEGVTQKSPPGFQLYRVTQTSSDNRCGRTTFGLVSPKTEQVLLGDIFPIEQPGKTLEEKIERLTAQLLKKPVKVNIEPTLLPDGLKRVNIVKQSEYGPFAYGAYLDSSKQFIIVGRRTQLQADPKRSLVDSVGVAKAASRGTKLARIEILELSDFQCPTCKRAHESLEPLISKNLNRINYSRLDLPLFDHHDWSLQAALIARAVQRVAPQHYWSYVDFIFDNQENIKRATVETVARGFVEDHDIDWKKIEPIYKSEAEKKELLRQIGTAFDNGIFSTPTYIVNGQVIFWGNDGDYLRNHLQSLLGGSGAGK